MRALEGMDKGLDLAELQRKATNPALQKLIDAKEREGSAGPTSESEAEGSGAELAVDSKEARENEQVDLDLVKKNPSKVYPQIYFGIKKVLKEWEASMAERPGVFRLMHPTSTFPLTNMTMQNPSSEVNKES